MSRSVPRKPSFPPARPLRRQADEYSDSEREESEYETEGEDIEHSPPRGRGDELDEDEYEEDVEEVPLSDEEMEVRLLSLMLYFFSRGLVLLFSNLLHVFLGHPWLRLKYFAADKNIFQFWQ
jgi:hypothetical protein